MRRVFWALVGVGLGVVVGIQVVRWAGRTKERYSPSSVARAAGGGLERFRERLREAIEEGVEEMAQREAELRDELGLPAQ